MTKFGGHEFYCEEPVDAPADESAKKPASEEAGS
jgi:hypothetical protein